MNNIIPYIWVKVVNNMKKMYENIFDQDEWTLEESCHLFVTCSEAMKVVA